MPTEIKFIAVKLKDEDHKEGRKFILQSLETDPEAKSSVAIVASYPPGTHWEITWVLMDDNGNVAVTLDDGNPTAGA